MKGNIRAGIAAAVFIAGIKYASLFEASAETAISNVSLYKAFKKSGGEPCKIKRNIAVLESWVNNRLERIAV